MSEKPIRVLLIEDNPGDVRLIRELLAEAGPALFEVTSVARLSAGLELLAERGADVLLLDLALPDCQGLDTFAKAHAQAPEVPIIVLTGLDDEARALRAVRDGAQDFLVKGRVDAAALARAVQYGLERKRIEDRLRESEARKAAFLESALDCVVAVDHEGNVTEFNSAAERTFGYSRAEIVGKRMATLLIPPSQRELHRAGVSSYRATGQSEYLGRIVERTAMRADGSEFPAELSIAPFSVFGGSGFLGVLRDITERKRAEEALRASEERYRTVVEHANDWIWTLDGNGGFTFMNRQAEAASGYRFEDWKGRSFTPLIHPADLESVVRVFQKTLAGEPQQYEARVRKANGEWLVLSVYTAPVRQGDEVVGTVSFGRDVTERERIERALRAIVEGTASATGVDFFRSLVRHLASALEVRWALIGELPDPAADKVRTLAVWAGEGFGENFEYDLAGAPCQNVVGQGQRCYPRDVRALFPADRLVAEMGVESYLGTPLFDATGAALGLLVVMDDKEMSETAGAESVAAVFASRAAAELERKRGEEALRRSEADYRGLVEHAPLGIYRATADGRFLTLNRALVEMLGYESADEVLGLDIPREVYTDSEQRVDLVAGFRSDDQAKTEVQWKRKDGSHITVQLNMRIVRSATGQIEYLEGLVEDVTERRSIEHQFWQAQRMEAVGRLAGGVAHDFNNILTVIVSTSELLLGDLGTDDPKRKDVEEIRAAAQRATGLTRQLLAFSRRQVLQLRVLSLNGVVEALGKMVRCLIGEDVTLEVKLDSELGAVRADPGQIEQVILNVVVNSRDAMPRGGRLTIETSNVDLDEAYVREHTGVSPGRYVMLAVSDTGVGMDADTRALIFEPFFTTKEPGKGTGLGLATVYGIVKQSRGFVWVYSEPGRGTTFKIYLPRVDAPFDAPDMALAVQPSPGGHEVVLLAEDDASVRRVVAEALEKKGYCVLPAPDGQTALDMARAQPGEIQLLITDLIMPGMTGRELAEVIAAERPHIRVLYMSGYTDDTVVRHGVLEAGTPYLQKPFTPGALAFKVREILDLRPSA
jgi:PAS domain S-box-containing protein